MRFKRPKQIIWRIQKVLEWKKDSYPNIDSQLVILLTYIIVTQPWYILSLQILLYTPVFIPVSPPLVPTTSIIYNMDMFVVTCVRFIHWPLIRILHCFPCWHAMSPLTVTVFCMRYSAHPCTTNTSHAQCPLAPLYFLWAMGIIHEQIKCRNNKGSCWKMLIQLQSLDKQLYLLWSNIL